MIWSTTDWALMGVAMLVFLTATVGAIAWLVHGMSAAPASRPERRDRTDRQDSCRSVEAGAHVHQ
jgi:hypothetical protein